MPLFGKKTKKKESEKGDDKAIVNTAKSSNNNFVQETRSYSYSIASSSSSFKSENVTKNFGENLSYWKSINSAPNLSSATSSSPLGRAQNNVKPPRSISLFDTDARPFQPTTFTPNYQSTFSRNLRGYASAREPTTSYFSSTSNSPSPAIGYQSPYYPARAPTNIRPTTITGPAPPSNTARLLPPISTTRPAAPISTTNNNSNNVSAVRVYNTNGKKRGYAIVINNVNFLKSGDERKGAEIDERSISRLFRSLGFDVQVHRNLKTSDMRNKIKKFSTDKSLAKGDISVVIMMSHGCNTDKNGQVVPGSFTQIIGTDGTSLPIEDVLAEFSTDKCPAMKGKPKVFIFQCCRGEAHESIHFDAVPIKQGIKQHGDILVAFSTLPGFYSIRDPKKGSWYIQSICDVFAEHSKTEDIESLLKIVDDELSRKHPDYTQTSSYENRGFKKCFLCPQ